MDNINFTGGFLFNNPNYKQWKKIYNEIVPSTRLIRHNIKGEGNILLVNSDKYDKEVTDYLLDRNILFSYYPNINAKTGVWNMKFDEVEKLVDESTPLTKAKDIQKYAKDLENKSTPIEYVWKDKDHIKQTLDALKTIERIPVDKLRYYTIKNVTLFYDENSKLVAKASPNNARGINYIQVYPRYDDESMELLKVGFNGEIHYRTNKIDKLQIFKRDFAAAVNTDKKRPRATT